MNITEKVDVINPALLFSSKSKAMPNNGVRGYFFDDFTEDIIEGELLYTVEDGRWPFITCINGTSTCYEYFYILHVCKGGAE